MERSKINGSRRRNYVSPCPFLLVKWEPFATAFEEVDPLATAQSGSSTLNLPLQRDMFPQICSVFVLFCLLFLFLFYFILFYFLFFISYPIYYPMVLLVLIFFSSSSIML